MKKTLSILMALILLLGIVVQPVSAAQESEKVQYLIDKGYIKGDNQGNLKLDKSITRAEFSKMMVVIDGKEGEAKNLKDKKTSFTDLPTSHWANGYVNQAVKDGYIKGYTDNTFRPEDNILYAEVLTILAKNSGYKPVETKTGRWADQYIDFAKNNKFLTDIEIKDFYDVGGREKVFEILYNYLMNKDSVKVSEVKEEPVKEVIVADVDEYHILQGPVMGPKKSSSKKYPIIGGELTTAEKYKFGVWDLFRYKPLEKNNDGFKFFLNGVEKDASSLWVNPENGALYIPAEFLREVGPTLYNLDVTNGKLMGKQNFAIDFGKVVAEDNESYSMPLSAREFSIGSLVRPDDNEHPYRIRVSIYTNKLAAKAGKDIEVKFKMVDRNNTLYMEAERILKTLGFDYSWDGKTLRLDGETDITKMKPKLYKEWYSVGVYNRINPEHPLYKYEVDN